MSIRYTAILAIAVVLSAIGTETNAQSFGQAGGAGGAGGGGEFGQGGFGSSGFGGAASGGAPGFAVAEDRFQTEESASSDFVGRDSDDTRQFFSALGNAQQSFLEDLGLQPRNNRGNTGRNNQAPPVRITLRVAFVRPVVTPETTSGVIKSHLVRSMQNRIAAPRVQVSGRTVVLSGQTATEYEKLVAERMALLEPGVSRVDNRLVVTTP